MFIRNDKWCDISDTYVDTEYHFCVVEISTWETELSRANREEPAKYLYRFDVVWDGDTQQMLESLIEGEVWEPYSKELFESMQKPVIPFNLLNAIGEKISELDVAYRTANATSFTYNGKEYAADPTAKTNLMFINGYIATENALPPDFPNVWQAMDGSIIPIMTVDDFKPLYAAIVAQGSINYVKLAMLESYVLALPPTATQADLDAIHW